MERLKNFLTTAFSVFFGLLLAGTFALIFWLIVSENGRVTKLEAGQNSIVQYLNSQTNK